jgi:hypothetical protein
VNEGSTSPTISLRERSFRSVRSEDRLSKWFVFSLLLHLALIAVIFLSPMLPSHVPPAPVYTVDLVGGEKIGGANLGTQLTPVPKQAAKNREDLPAPPPRAQEKRSKEGRAAKGRKKQGEARREKAAPGRKNRSQREVQNRAGEKGAGKRDQKRSEGNERGFQDGGRVRR